MRGRWRIYHNNVINIKFNHNIAIPSSRILITTNSNKIGQSEVENVMWRDKQENTQQSTIHFIQSEKGRDGTSSKNNM